MNNFIKLEINDAESVKNYIYSHFYECLDLAKCFDKKGLKKDLLSKYSGQYYGYFKDEQLHGIFLFTYNKRFLFHFDDDDVIKKVDLLKAIRHHKPEFMSATSQQASKVWSMFERTVKRYTYNESMYMILDESTSIQRHPLVREAEKSDVKTKSNFFVDVEKKFGRNHMTINQILSRIIDRHGKHEYLVYTEDDKIVGQGMVEDKINAFHQIGGVFTVPSFRNKGIGKAIMEGLVLSIQDNGGIPLLAVLSQNKSAVELYKSLRFKPVATYSIIEIEF